MQPLVSRAGHQGFVECNLDGLLNFKILKRTVHILKFTVVAQAAKIQKDIDKGPSGT